MMVDEGRWPALGTSFEAMGPRDVHPPGGRDIAAPAPKTTLSVAEAIANVQDAAHLAKLGICTAHVAGGQRGSMADAHALEDVMGGGGGCACPASSSVATAALPVRNAVPACLEGPVWQTLSPPHSGGPTSPRPMRNLRPSGNSAELLYLAPNPDAHRPCYVPPRVLASCPSRSLLAAPMLQSPRPPKSPRQRRYDPPRMGGDPPVDTFVGVSTWLDDIGLQQYSSLAVERGISWQELLGMSDQELFDQFEFTHLTHFSKLKRALKSPPPCAVRHCTDPQPPSSPIPPPSPGGPGSSMAGSPQSPSNVRRPRPPPRTWNASSSFPAGDGPSLAVPHTEAPRVGRHATPSRGLPRTVDSQPHPHQMNLMALRRGVDLGSGSFTSVALAIWEGREVAVKTLSQQLLPLEQQWRFWDDVGRCVELPQHLNVVQTLGLVAKPLALVQQYNVNGSLRPLLIRNPHIPLKTLVGVAAGVAAGMQHLSSHGVLHRNLCTQNVMLSPDWVPQVSDYGINREEFGDSSSGLRLKWMAPESLRHRQSSTQSDIWSFGVLLWEVLARGHEPYEGRDPVDVAMAVVTSGSQLSMPPDCPEVMERLITACLSFSPDERPSFAELQSNLCSIAGSPPTLRTQCVADSATEDV
eukprot:GGOE01006051.1.p1 GENE.GGOE01006051.1~~GGOE01006051.1.p1  ORF type:complete len:638 (-),score=110.24 GGOE01006051.1:1251-3164(-)